MIALRSDREKRLGYDSIDKTTDTLPTDEEVTQGAKLPSYPHGGLRTFHQKSTRLKIINFTDFSGANWSRITPESGVAETLEAHRVEVCTIERFDRQDLVDRHPPDDRQGSHPRCEI